MNKGMQLVLAVCFLIGIVLGITALIWLLWCWAMPQIWESGPRNIIDPGFWLFAVCWFLFGCAGRAIFGIRQKIT